MSYPLPSQLGELAIPLAIASLIFLFSALTFGVWSRRIAQTRRAVQQLDATLARTSADAAAALQTAQAGVRDATLRHLLRETAAGLIALPTPGTLTAPRTPVGDAADPNADANADAPPAPTLCSLRPHSELWTVHELMGPRMSLALFETMPNLLIGFGLMCTFVFLAVALQQAGVALNAIDASARQQDQALQSLIATAGGKFITSIAGLFCSLLWNWRAKVAIGRLQAALDALCHTLRARIPDNAAEAGLRLQMTLLHEMLHTQQAQTGHLQRLEVALARDLGASLSQNMQPAFAKLDTLADFGQTAQTLAQTMQGMRDTVLELDAALARSSQASQQGSAQMSQWSEGLGQSMQTLQATLGQLDRIMGQIHQTASSFEHSAQSIGEAVQQQRQTAEDFKHGASTLHEALDTTHDQLRDAEKALHGTVDALTQGVSAYSGQIATLHTRMDQHLASAVNQLGGTITNLEEVLDEFIDALPARQG